MQDFGQLGRREAIRQLFEGTPFEPFRPALTEGGSRCLNASRLLLEGIDFDLIYFPLKHLGYKSVAAVTGELYAGLASPATLKIALGVSAKLGFDRIKELWSGVVSAAQEFGYKSLGLELQPSLSGLSISVSATGTLSGSERPVPASKDLLCVSGALGAAYLGLQLLERGARSFGKDGVQPDMSQYKMLVGDYLRPELDASVVSRLEDAEIYPSYAYFVTHGLSDALKRLSRDSGLGAKVYAEKIPFEGNSFQLGRELDLDPVSAAMNGGDDNRLLFVVPILHLERFRRDFQTFDIIGHLARPEVGTVLVTPEGVEFPVKAQGWPEPEEN